MNEHQFGTTDDDFDNVESTDNTTAIYDELRNELATPVATDPIRIQVPSRPTVELLIEPDIEFDLLQTWMKRSTNRKTKNYDAVKFSNQVISFCTKGIAVRGKEVVDSDGDPITFTSRELQQMVHANTVQECIKKLIGKDGHMILIAQKIVEEAGYGDEVLDVESGENPLSII